MGLKDNKIIYRIGHSLNLFRIKLKVIPYTFNYFFADRIKLNTNNKNSDKKYLILRSSDFTGLMTHMLATMGWVKYAIENNYTLLVNLGGNNNQYSAGNENTWEMYYKQPMINERVNNDYIESIMQNENYAIAHNCTRYNLTFSKSVPRWVIRVFKPTIPFPKANDFVRDGKVQLYWEEIYKDYIKPKPEVLEYAEAEYNEIIENKGKVLGVLLRGTDYIAKKPYNHHIQPDINSVLEKIKEYKEKYNWDFIYLASEDGKYEEILKKKYSGKILTNKRTYDYGEEGRDMFQYGLAYFSSMYLLSKCDMLIAGLCGGSQAALLMNQHNYEQVYVFDIGKYK